MSEAMQLWGEIVFNIAYLVIVWGLVWAMTRRLPQLPQANHPLAVCRRDFFPCNSDLW